MIDLINKILEYLNNSYPKIAGYFLLVFLIAYFTIKCYKFYSSTKVVCNEFPSITSKLDKLLQRFSSLIVVLAEKKTIKDSAVFKVESPVGLTPEGYELIKKIGWSGIINDDKNKNILFGILDKQNLSNKHDVEKGCIIIMYDLNGAKEENQFTPIKRYLYEHGDIDEESVLIACALDLRDKYLAIHPEIQ